MNIIIIVKYNTIIIISTIDIMYSMIKVINIAIHYIQKLLSSHYNEKIYIYFFVYI